MCGDLGPDRVVPLHTWIRHGSRPVVTTELFAQDEQQLRARVLKLQRRVQLLLSVTRLLLLLVRRFGFRLDSQRVPSGEAKSSILGAIARAKQRIPVTVALRVLGLSASRYHAWLRLDQSCSVDDRSSCPRTVPTQLTRQEISTVQQMATAMEYRHMPIRVLAWYASAHRQGVRGPRYMGSAHPRTGLAQAATASLPSQAEDRDPCVATQ